MYIFGNNVFTNYLKNFCLASKPLIRFCSTLTIGENNLDGIQGHLNEQMLIMEHLVCCTKIGLCVMNQIICSLPSPHPKDGLFNSHLGNGFYDG